MRRASGNPTITLLILRLVSAPSRRCASLRPARWACGLDPASNEPRIGSCVMVAKLMTLTTCRRSDKRRESEAAGAGQSREAPTERREGLSCASASAKCEFGASVRNRLLGSRRLGNRVSDGCWYLDCYEPICGKQVVFAALVNHAQIPSRSASSSGRVL